MKTLKNIVFSIKTSKNVKLFKKTKKPKIKPKKCETVQKKQNLRV